MTREDAELIDCILKHGVDQFEEKKNEEDLMWLTLDAIRHHGGFSESIAYMDEILYELQSLFPCPISIERGDLTVLEFSEMTVKFYERGGYLAIYDERQAQAQKTETRAEAAHQVNLNSIKGSWVVYASLILSVISLLVAIFK